jgi:hypothetical protein
VVRPPGDLETDGTCGYATIFNFHVPRRGPLNLPFLGLGLKNERLLSEQGAVAVIGDPGYSSAPPVCPERSRRLARQRR